MLREFDLRFSQRALEQIVVIPSGKVPIYFEMDISSKKFLLVPAPEGLDSHHGDARKVYLSPEVLRVHKLNTTDVVAIAGGNFANTKVRYC